MLYSQTAPDEYVSPEKLFSRRRSPVKRFFVLVFCIIFLLFSSIFFYFFSSHDEFRNFSHFDL